ncbi:M20 aminoacylase family protein [Marinobacterium mangrovicola]|uniref:Hippurate hydrolase n=1 Tax=Marinobacterium mangrovicola TaxID=1476959 RepID=A0A4R1G4R0_9GAMM|nr:M20 aminoacylase family protein [Marinobacterium mangrovicola]TCK02967.1 hippurate hydrolase [Marinobacterium mangrovicola]
MTQLIDGLVEQMTTWRHQMHRLPETGFDVHMTAQLIASLLKEWGLEVHEGIGQTGVVAVLRKGDRPDRKMIALRADTDALPITELNTFDHRSSVDGKMHGCGHDGHSAMLLGAACQLAKRGEFEGTVVFIFQPNEEHGLGAQAMIDDGLFERFPATEVYGMHNLPGLEAGVLALRAGAIMASESLLEIQINGCGGHASSPHLVNDPIIPATHLVQGLQTIVSRTVDPSEAVVVSVTEVLTDGARNVIPSTVTLKGDCRTFNDATTDQVERRIRTLAAGISEAFDTLVEVTFSREFFVTHNAEAQTQAAQCAALKVNGPERVLLDVPPKSFSEDFACLQRVVPGCYVFLGNGADSRGGCMLHNPHYDFNDNILETGALYWTALVEQQL